MKISKLAILRSFLQTKHFSSLEKLHAFQQQRLQYVLSHHGASFYPNSLNLEDYPIIDKSVFMANLNALTPHTLAKKTLYAWQ